MGLTMGAMPVTFASSGEQFDLSSMLRVIGRRELKVVFT
jgi:hypothetical protein